MKNAARDGSDAPAFAITTTPIIATEAAAANTNSMDPMPTGRSSGNASADGAGSGSDGRGRQKRPSTAAYREGQEIFSPGNGGGFVYIVRNGCVRLYKTLPDGRSINLGLLGPNTIFAQEDGYDGLATGASAEAMIDSNISIVEIDDLAELIAESPDLASAVVSGMSRRLTELQTLVEQLLVRDTSVRLVTTLLSLAKGFGQPTADGMVSITLPVTHQGLANMIGSNRVTVTRKLAELQEGGLVRSLGRNAVAVDPDKLRRFAQAAGAPR